MNNFNPRSLVASLLLAFSAVPAAAQFNCIVCVEQNERIYGPVNNLVQNGSFEMNTCGLGGFYCPASAGYVCDIQGWTCTGGGTSTYAQIFDPTYSIIADGQYAAYMGNAFCEVCGGGGDTTCLVSDGCTMAPLQPGFPSNSPDMGGTTGVSLVQTVNGLVPGATYVLEFWSGGEGFNAFPEKGLFGVNVGFGDILMRCNPTTAGSTDVGARYAAVFTATSTSTTIKFTNWGHINGMATEMVLDDVRLFAAGELPCFDGVAENILPDVVHVQPNPFTNTLSLERSTNGPAEVTLFDITGRIVMTESMGKRIILNTEKLSAGPYTYAVRAKNGTVVTGKVVKE